MVEVRRGDVVLVADRGGGDYAGKPRPAVVVQGDAFGATASVVVCLLTTTELDAPLLRLPLLPSDSLPLREPSWIMVDKIVAVSRQRIGRVLGRLRREDQLRLDRALVTLLGIG